MLPNCGLSRSTLSAWRHARPISRVEEPLQSAISYATRCACALTASWLANAVVAKLATEYLNQPVWSSLTPMLLMIVILLVRPRGLFGKEE